MMSYKNTLSAACVYRLCSYLCCKFNVYDKINYLQRFYFGYKINSFAIQTIMNSLSRMCYTQCNLCAHISFSFLQFYLSLYFFKFLLFIASIEGKNQTQHKFRHQSHIEFLLFLLLFWFERNDKHSFNKNIHESNITMDSYIHWHLSLCILVKYILLCM